MNNDPPTNTGAADDPTTEIDPGLIITFGKVARHLLGVLDMVDGDDPIRELAMGALKNVQRAIVCAAGDPTLRPVWKS